MRVLITGSSGFAGTHLARWLCAIEPTCDVFGTVFGDGPDHLPAAIQRFPLDLCDAGTVEKALHDIQPNQIYHLAGQASPALSFEQPWETIEANLRAQINLFESCLKLGLQSRILVVSSAEFYDPREMGEHGLNENAAFRPTSPYGVSKVAQDMLALQYALAHNLEIVRARPFNHVGPGQSDKFVAPAFALQIARIEAGLQERVLSVGNLSARRDFTDVRDVVRAYYLLMSSGRAGEAYNIASGTVHSIEQVLHTLLSFTPVEVEVQVDPAKMRPVDIQVIRGDSSKLRRATGWQPEYSFEDSMRDLLEECRQRIHQ